MLALLLSFLLVTQAPAKPASAVWQEGSFLATRWEEEAAVNLYHMEGGFFAEVYYDQHQDVLVRTRTFTSLRCLEDYTPYIRLDNLEKIKAPARWLKRL